MNRSAPIASTIVVTPRERFEFAVRSLESLYENTKGPFALVYVDAGSPRDVARRLRALARERDFTLIRCDRYLAPNQARNLGLEFVATEYVVLADNDVVFAPGWLAALERCAAETGAAIVTPLTCIGNPPHTIVHNVGGAADIAEDGGRLLFTQSHPDVVGRRVDEIRGRLKRETTGQCEFHACLIRTEMFARHGKLDENNLSVCDHSDLSIAVRRAGGEIYFEPQSVVTYIPERLRPRELPFYMLRWSEAWARHSHRTFLAKWQAEDGKPHYTYVDFVREYRAFALPVLRRRAVRWCGWRVGSRIVELVEWGLAAIGSARFAGLGAPPRYRVVHEGGKGSGRPAAGAALAEAGAAGVGSPT